MGEKQRGIEFGGGGGGRVVDWGRNVEERGLLGKGVSGIGEGDKGK